MRGSLRLGAICALALLAAAPVQARTAPAAAGHARALLGGQTIPMYVTLYGYVDNSPPGRQIAYPVIHKLAGGVGTYKNPITFATDKLELAPGTIVYYPYLDRYFIMEDDCAQCDSDWANHHKWHIDLWAGGDKNSVHNPEKKALLAFENALTRAQAPVIVNPPATMMVDTTPLFNAKTLQCYTPH